MTRYDNSSTGEIALIDNDVSVLIQAISLVSGEGLVGGSSLIDEQPIMIA